MTRDRSENEEAAGDGQPLEVKYFDEHSRTRYGLGRDPVTLIGLATTSHLVIRCSCGSVAPRRLDVRLLRRREIPVGTTGTIDLVRALLSQFLAGSVRRFQFVSACSGRVGGGLPDRFPVVDDFFRIHADPLRIGPAASP